MLILERARRALDVVSAIRGLAIRDHEPMEGPLRLGVIPRIGPYLIPQVLTVIRSGFPKRQLFLREDRTNNLLKRLRQATLDALLLALPVRGEDIQTMGLFRAAFVVALPKEHSLVRRKHLGEGTLTHDMMLSDPVQAKAFVERTGALASSNVDALLRSQFGAPHGKSCSRPPSAATLYTAARPWQLSPCTRSTASRSRIRQALWPQRGRPTSLLS